MMTPEPRPPGRPSPSRRAVRARWTAFAVALALAAALPALPACSARTRGGGASCDPACGSASCGFDGCGAACGAHQGGCGTGQVCAGSGGAPATCVTEVRPECGAPPSGTPGDLVARIIVDEPSAYTAAGGNQCAPADGSCYFPDLGVSLTRGHAPLAVFFQGWRTPPSSPSPTRRRARG